MCEIQRLCLVFTVVDDSLPAQRWPLIPLILVASLAYLSAPIRLNAAVIQCVAAKQSAPKHARSVAEIPGGASDEIAPV